VSEGFVEAFTRAHRAGQKAFNSGDFEKAFAGLAPEVEWELLPFLPEAGGVIRGREAVARYFAGVRDVFNWHVEAQEFIEIGPGRVLVRQRGTGSGRLSGILAGNDFFQLWQLNEQGAVTRVTEYESRERASEALGQP
jgi:ketosteroid isomerase-like protein